MKHLTKNANLNIHHHIQKSHDEDSDSPVNIDIASSMTQIELITKGSNSCSPRIN